MIEVLFLGTGAGTPSRQSGLPSAAVRKGGEIYLLDCGEGTQRQLMVSPFSYMKIKAVLISHLHGDHFLGLPGLLLTMGISERKDPIAVIGPAGTERLLIPILEACGDELPFELNVIEADDGHISDIGKMTVSVFKTDHTVPSLGFVLSEKDRYKADPSKISGSDVRPGDVDRILKGETIKGVTAEDLSAGIVKGLKIAYSGDTKPCESLKKAVKDVDLLIHEATFDSELKGPAEEYGHTTAEQAAEIARECNVRHLCLTHVSNRYRNRSVLKEEASAIFPDTCVAEDMMRLSVTRKEIKLI